MGTPQYFLVMPQILKELMRHESIETTMRYYVGRSVQATAAILWQAADQFRKPTPLREEQREIVQ
jgi:integrase